MKPRDFIEFRGSKIEGEARVWNQVLYPEKLGLALKVVRKSPGAG